MTQWGKLSRPSWAVSPPNLFDIVVGFYPESQPKAGTPAHRPCLVTAVYADEAKAVFACEIAFGTKRLKTLSRGDIDLIIQNSTDLDEMGLAVATRFDLDSATRVVLEWNDTNFKPWTGYNTPKIGALTLPYQKDYVWLMAKRNAIG